MIIRVNSILVLQDILESQLVTWCAVKSKLCCYICSSKKIPTLLFQMIECTIDMLLSTNCIAFFAIEKKGHPNNFYALKHKNVGKSKLLS